MQPLLTILIPTVVGREAEVDRLIGNIDLQCSILFVHNEVEVIQLKDNKEITIGEKRERLYKMANGLFSWQIDDDDAIAPDAIETILSVIIGNTHIPCITFRENCMMNGEYKSSNHSIKYDRWADNFDGYDYTRCPFYKDVIRTDIAQSIPFEYIRYNEDEKFSMAIKPLLTDEAHIDKEIYFYIYEPKDTHEERYGLSK